MTRCLESCCCSSSRPDRETRLKKVNQCRRGAGMTASTPVMTGSVRKEIETFGIDFTWQVERADLGRDTALYSNSRRRSSCWWHRIFRTDAWPSWGMRPRQEGCEGCGWKVTSPLDARTLSCLTCRSKETVFFVCSTGCMKSEQATFALGLASWKLDAAICFYGLGDIFCTCSEVWCELRWNRKGNADVSPHFGYDY